MSGLALLRSNRAFRTLWCARTTSFVGDSLSLVALILYTADQSGEAIAVALLLLVGDFAPALLGPFTGALSDRLNLKRLMIACELAQGALVALIALLLPSLPLLLALVALRALAAQVFQPASRSAVPALVADEDLEGANAALGAGTNGLEVLGPLLAVALLPVLDIQGVLLVDAASFGLSALLLAALPSLPATEVERSSLFADAREGLGYIWSVPLVRAVGLGFFAIVAVNGVDDVALVFLAKDELDSGDGGASLLYAGVGAGLMVGYALLAWRAARLPMAGLLIAGFAINSAGNLLTGVAWALAAALAVQSVRGLGLAAMDVATNTLLQRTVPPAMLGRVFGNLYGAIGVAAGLSYALGGLLLALTDPRTTFVAVGAAGLAASLACALALRRS